MEQSESENFMRLALEQAELALNNEEVPVGCIFINQRKEIIAKGYNKTNENLNGTEHAELVAIKDASFQRKMDPSDFVGSTLFVSCEPCIMCAAALSRMKIKEVYFGCFNDRFGGNGSILSVHDHSTLNGGAGYEIYSGILKDEAIAVFQKFYDTENRRAPDHKRRRKG
jgi:tRNA-specific adenosine deaminase 2